ncbi:hypothetical protein SUDANB171_01481 [Streptomyces sp. enrichment culture]|uniref:hypothetical protein n=1 Tax=Streptomyces sp. enrichment culture TaxID=1795815 RepID=UPI003F5760A4
MKPGSEPSWIPSPGSGARAVPCGRWFDAVQVPRTTAAVLLTLVPSRGVVEDQTNDTMAWFIPVSARAVPVGGVRVLGIGDLVHVPPADRGPLRGGVWRWAAPPCGDCVSDPAPLCASLAALEGCRAERCVRCGGVAYPPAVITASGPRGRQVSVTACQEHADDTTAWLRCAAAIAGTERGPS